MLWLEYRVNYVLPRPRPTCGVWRERASQIRAMFLAATILAGCGLDQQAFEAVGQDDAGPYRLTLTDSTGEVSGLDAVLPTNAITLEGASLEGSALTVWWLGSICDDTPSLSLQRDAGALIVEVEEDHPTGCDDVGIPRGAVVRADREWAASEVEMRGP